ncbi:MAG: ComEA family DNA-binding protein [Gammaproteobacteria bacterium]
MIPAFSRSLLAALALLPGLVFAGPVDVNSATAEQLSESLNGVGPQKAAAIVAYRQQHGPFQSVADLTKVKGVGENLLDKNKGLIQIGQGEPEAQ